MSLTVHANFAGAVAAALAAAAAAAAAGRKPALLRRETSVLGSAGRDPARHSASRGHGVRLAATAAAVVVVFAVAGRGLRRGE